MCELRSRFVRGRPPGRGLPELDEIDRTDTCTSSVYRSSFYSSAFGLPGPIYCDQLSAGMECHPRRSQGVSTFSPPPGTGCTPLEGVRAVGFSRCL